MDNESRLAYTMLSLPEREFYLVVSQSRTAVSYILLRQSKLPKSKNGKIVHHKNEICHPEDLRRQKW